MIIFMFTYTFLENAITGHIRYIPDTRYFLTIATYNSTSIAIIQPLTAPTFPTG